MDLKKYTYIEEFGGKFEMIVYNIEYDRMFIVPAVCPGGSKEEEIDMDFVYYMLEDGRWKIKVKGLRNREATTEKWNFFMELNEEDAKSAWDRRKEILKKGYVKKRQYPDEFLEMMTRESRIIMASEEARRTRFNEYMQDELQLLGEILPGEGDGLPDLDYLPTTPEDEVAAGGEQDGEVPQRVGEEGQHGEADEGSEERYPPPSDAADSDCRGPYGDSHVPRVFELGDFSPEEELEIMYGTREEREAMFREIEMCDEQMRQQEQQEGNTEDVEMERADLPEASTTPTSLEEPSFFSNMLDELRDGVEPHARIVIEAAMEASNLAWNTNGDDLEVMMRVVRDTAMEAFDDNRTPRQREEGSEQDLKDVVFG